MKTLFAFLAAALVLGGCATSRTIIGQDGKPLHKISCDGSALGMDACYEKAGELCEGAGYDVIGQDGTAQPYFFASGGSFYSGAMVTRSLLARCREMRGIVRSW